MNVVCSRVTVRNVTPTSGHLLGSLALLLCLANNNELTFVPYLVGLQIGEQCSYQLFLMDPQSRFHSWLAFVEVFEKNSRHHVLNTTGYSLKLPVFSYDQKPRI